MLAVVLSLSLPAMVFAQGTEAGKEGASSVLDRLAVKTNAVDWLATIPNIGLEFDLKDSEFNNMTLGLSAKYNWNTYHRHDLSDNYAPPSVFNLFDIRPEFRYYYRDVEKGTLGKRWTVDKFLKEKKRPKSWRANYVGAYVNYGTYALKFGEKGYQGNAIGIGASAGYSFPMYEYKTGAIDIELGFSVGLQVATKEKFVHNPDGYFYAKIDGGRDHFGLTPFPVVSDLRVAFVWRHKSIKDKVKVDEDRQEVEAHYNTIVVDYNYDQCTKEIYDETLVNTKGERESARIRADEEEYRAGFAKLLDEQQATLTQNLTQAFPEGFRKDERVIAIVKEYEAKLQNLIVNGRKQALNKFNRLYAAEKKDKKQADMKVQKEKKAAEKEVEKQEKATKDKTADKKAEKKEKAPKKKADKEVVLDE